MTKTQRQEQVALGAYLKASNAILAAYNSGKISLSEHQTLHDEAHQKYRSNVN